MIRQDLDVVPTVLPKHRLEEDARQAAKRMEGKPDESNVQITRYPIVPCAPERESDEKDNNTDLRLFSVVSSPEIGMRVPHKLHVVHAPKRSWKRVRRTVYNGTLPATDSDGEDETHRFTSLPMPEYENMSCFLLTLPEGVHMDSDGETAGEGVAAEETEPRAEAKEKTNRPAPAKEEKEKEKANASSAPAAAAVAVARELSHPLHALRHERADAAKDGRGISTSWHSGINLRAVHFKRSYIDEDEDEGDEGGGEAEAEAERGDGHSRRRNGRGAARPPPKKEAKAEREEETTAGRPAETNAASGAAKREKEAAERAKEAKEAAERAKEAKEAAEKTNEVVPEIVGVSPGDIGGCTAALLRQWAATGKAAAPFAEVARVVLKQHPEYAVMKARHQSPNGRQEAVEWFRVSQSAVRMHILQLGYMLDSSNNVHLS